MSQSISNLQRITKPYQGVLFWPPQHEAQSLCVVTHLCALILNWQYCRGLERLVEEKFGIFGLRCTTFLVSSCSPTLLLEPGAQWTQTRNIWVL